MLQVKDLLDGIPVIQELVGNKISFNIGYKIQKITSEIDVVTGEFDKARTTLLEKYGTLSEDQTAYSFEDGNRELYDAAMDILVNEEIDIKFKKISDTNKGRL